LDDLPEAVRLGLGEEADVPEVDADERDVAAPDELGRVQERAVAAEDEDELGIVARTELVERLDPQGPQAVGDVGGRGHGLLAPRVPGGEDAVGRGAASGRRSTAAAITASGSSGGWARSGSRRKPMKYSTFPLGPGSGLGTTAKVCSPSAAAASATV